MSALREVRGTGLPQAHSLTTPDRAPEGRRPYQYQRLREKSKASQVMGKTREGSSGAAIRPPVLPEARAIPGGAMGCGRSLQSLVPGGRGPAATEVRQDVAPVPVAGLEAASVSEPAQVGLKDGVQGGEKVLEAGGAGRSAPEVTAKGGKTEEGASGSVAVDEKPVGDGMEVEGDEARGEARQEPGPPPLDISRCLKPLQAIKQALDHLNAQADRVLLQLDRHFGRMRQHYLRRRNYVIRSIPGFWVTVFRNHPQLSAVVRGQDARMLRYVTHLEVKECRHPWICCKFKFFFRRNPYFTNRLIVKKYEVRAPGQVVSLSTPIAWRPGHEPQSFIGRGQEVTCGFFAWFSDHSLPECDRIAEIIREDLWPNPLLYYQAREEAGRVRHRQIREAVEIPRPFGFHSG
ncbi:testis-specific Y-encoded-like protein 1 [Carlito syrichta]|uniref:Testis-specific Y-encoded-like protein 1 n=1 Tax=Carlito syrichta TaxID=1868482 RepID=A0A1U7SKV2_CARSF|nr:testis-specific Y-encoded-like protein 1 [Carlito syrichta]